MLHIALIHGPDLLVVRHRPFICRNSYSAWDYAWGCFSVLPFCELSSSCRRPLRLFRVDQSLIVSYIRSASQAKRCAAATGGHTSHTDVSSELEKGGLALQKYISQGKSVSSVRTDSLRKSQQRGNTLPPNSSCSTGLQDNVEESVDPATEQKSAAEGADESDSPPQQEEVARSDGEPAKPSPDSQTCRQETEVTSGANAPQDRSHRSAAGELQKDQLQQGHDVVNSSTDSGTPEAQQLVLKGKPMLPEGKERSGCSDSPHDKAGEPQTIREAASAGTHTAVAEAEASMEGMQHPESVPQKGLECQSSLEDEKQQQPVKADAMSSAEAQADAPKLNGSEKSPSGTTPLGTSPPVLTEKGGESSADLHTEPGHCIVGKDAGVLSDLVKELPAGSAAASQGQESSTSGLGGDAEASAGNGQFMSGASNQSASKTRTSKSKASSAKAARRQTLVKASSEQQPEGSRQESLNDKPAPPPNSGPTEPIDSQQLASQLIDTAQQMIQTASILLSIPLPAR